MNTDVFIRNFHEPERMILVNMKIFFAIIHDLLEKISSENVTEGGDMTQFPCARADDLGEYEDHLRDHPRLARKKYFQKM
jgi:hypothetical protein